MRPELLCRHAVIQLLYLTTPGEERLNISMHLVPYALS